MNNNLKDFNTLVETSITDELEYIENLKEFIHKRCEEQPSIKKIIELAFNEKYYFMLRKEIGDKEFYMYECCQKLMDRLDYQFSIESVYDDIVDGKNYHFYRIYRIAKFIRTFFGKNKDDFQGVTFIEFLPTYNEGKFVCYFYTNIFNVSSPLNEPSEDWFKKYTKNPDDWLAFFERYAEEKMKEDKSCK